MTVETKTKSNKESKYKRKLPTQGTVAECTKQLIEVDVIRKMKSKKTKSKKNDTKPERGFTFVNHYFTQHYQQKQYTKCIENLEEGQAVYTQDFSNSIDMTPQDEAKVARYGGALQVTCHPTVIYPKFPGKDPKKEKIVITHLSAIKNHDAHMVYHITKDCINYLIEEFPEIKWKKIYLWSDGCTQQYKSKTSFYYLKKFNIDVERNFFGSEHGKNESDGVTGEISRKLHDAIKSRNHEFDCAEDVQNFLSENMPKYVFRMITDSDLKPIYDDFKNVNLKVLSGKCTRSLHQIKPSKKKDEYLVRLYSCFCSMCTKKLFESCVNIGYTNGIFTPRILDSSGTNNHEKKKRKGKEEYQSESGCEGVEEEDQDEDLVTYSDGDDSEEDLEEEEVEEEPLEICQQIIKFEDLEVDQFIVGSNHNGHFDAIIKVKNNDSITVDILKQDSQTKDLFKSSNESGYIQQLLPVSNIVMILPDPTPINQSHRFYSYLFDLPINL